LKKEGIKIDIKSTKYFLFTQNSLSTFRKCPLKFKKKYIDNIKWEIFKEDASRKLGNDFHMLAYRYFSGISDEYLDYDEDERMKIWFERLKNAFPIKDNYRYLPEYKIRLSDVEERLEANYDLIIVKENAIEIWDWKTRELDRQVDYIDSIQTKVYMYLLKRCVKDIFNMDIDYENIKMTYWTPEPGCEIDKLVYSKEKYDNDKRYILKLLDEIYNYDYTKFNKQNYAKQCRYCEFDSFCRENSIVKQEFSSELTWDDVEEVEF